jgi:hypothetical protein
VTQAAVWKEKKKKKRRRIFIHRKKRKDFANKQCNVLVSQHAT